MKLPPAADPQPFIDRILASYRDQNTSALRSAISDAHDSGIPVEHLITVLAANLTDSLNQSGALS
ncbi:hypothetical protein Csp2054_12145 [Curtobacterium sp. 'Ferrero']|uniref:hypothetical protein n=1 Tax=Curtobacterium sp. 'Ferrero' TaxID=2033654 RepID=UPI000BCCDF9B|nr:hypothetical protein [Curtobacterium sp. 'Ferrero']PCN47410.1 hypothetical protein Csp2054_12145 [Curtobacterium sp. 'Ferrero']